MNEKEILQCLPKGAIYFAMIFSSSDKSRPVFLDGLVGENQYYWVPPESGSGAWEKIDVDSICVDAVELIRLVDDIRSLYSKDQEIIEQAETISECRDDICHLRSKYNDHD